MTSSLVGSEMCIRDSSCSLRCPSASWQRGVCSRRLVASRSRSRGRPPLPVSYTHLTLPTICSV
eukprot:10185861-Prorocentrum_lima.AAC.1